MKTSPKLLLTITYLIVLSVATYAKPGTGIKFGANYTFYKDNPITRFSPQLGYQAGYSKALPVNEKFALTVEGLFSNKVAFTELITDYPQFGSRLNIKRNAYYLSAPLSLNYLWGPAYFGIGYEFGVMVSGNLPVNNYDHAIFIQTAYKVGSFDIVLKYAGTVNKEPGGTIAHIPDQDKQMYTPKANSFQLSLVYSFGKN